MVPMSTEVSVTLLNMIAMPALLRRGLGFRLPHSVLLSEVFLVSETKVTARSRDTKGGLPAQTQRRRSRQRYCGSRGIRGRRSSTRASPARWGPASAVGGVLLKAEPRTPRTESGFLLSWVRGEKRRNARKRRRGVIPGFDVLPLGRTGPER